MKCYCRKESARAARATRTDSETKAPTSPSFVSEATELAHCARARGEAPRCSERALAARLTPVVRAQMKRLLAEQSFAPRRWRNRRRSNSGVWLALIEREARAWGEEAGLSRGNFHRLACRRDLSAGRGRSLPALTATAAARAGHPPAGPVADVASGTASCG
jgi:hypothetical protein